MKGNQLELPVSTRRTGKHFSRQLRMKGQVPGVIYGNKVDTLQVAAEEKLIKKYSASAFENTIFNITSADVKGANKLPVLLKAIDVDPVTRRPVHFDMYVVDMNKTVKVYVELRFEGKAIGLSEGGLLQAIMREIEVECLPKDIPDFIAVDVTSLSVHQTLHISEITLPAGVKAVATSDLALVTVTVVQEEVIAAPVAAADGTAPTAAEPEVIKKGKQEEAGAEGAAAKPGAAPAKAAPAAKSDKK